MEISIQLDSKFEYTFSFSQEQVIAFAEVTGDNNPIHLDEAYAKTTVFKQRILHGFLGASVFSKVFGTMFPGEGTVYLKQSMSFLRPMIADTNYKAIFTVSKVFSEKNRAIVKTEVFNDRNKAMISGEALIVHKNIS